MRVQITITKDISLLPTIPNINNRLIIVDGIERKLNRLANNTMDNIEGII